MSTIADVPLPRREHRGRPFRPWTFHINGEAAAAADGARIGLRSADTGERPVYLELDNAGLSYLESLIARAREARQLAGLED